MHQQLMQTLKMHTTDKHQGMPRLWSYHRHGRSCKSNEDSRIGDIFISESLCCHKLPVTTIADTTGDSDHSPIYATILLTSIRFTKPGPDPTPLLRDPRLKTPVPAGALQQYTVAVDLELSAAIAVLNAELDSSMETALQQLDPHRLNSDIKAQLAHVGINTNLIETHSKSLQDKLEQLHPIAKGILPYTTGSDGKCFKIRSRRDSKELCRLRRLRKALHTAVRLHRHNRLQSMKMPRAASAHQATTQDPIKSQAQNELQVKINALMTSVLDPAKHQDRFPKPPMEADKDAWACWEEQCVSERGKAAKQKERIVQLLRQKDSLAARRHIQTMYNNNQWKTVEQENPQRRH